MEVNGFNHKEDCVGDMKWICIAGNCDGCHMKSVCDQPVPYVDGHEEEMIEGTIQFVKRINLELVADMARKGRCNLSEFRGKTLSWLRPWDELRGGDLHCLNKELDR